MTDNKEIERLAQKALEKAVFVSQAISQAAETIKGAGPAPEQISTNWTDKLAQAGNILDEALEELDSGGYEQSPLAHAVIDLRHKVRKTHNDYLDSHRDDYYTLSGVLNHHFLVDNRRGGHIIAFDNPEDAQAWHRYHGSKAVQTLDSETIPITGLNPISTADVLNAVARKKLLEQETAGIRDYLNQQDNQQLEQVRKSITDLPPQLRRKLTELPVPGNSH